MEKPVDASMLMLTEGKDDEHVIKALFGQLELPWIKFKNCESYSNVLTQIPTQAKGSGVKVLGIVIDADEDFASRWVAVRNRVLEAGYPEVPQTPPPNGLIIERPENTRLPRLGVWMMPNNVDPGILENFLHEFVPANDPLFAHACESTERIPAEQRLFKKQYTPKAIIHSWLAWQEEPGKPLGLSITARVLDSNSPIARVFIDWCRNLFSQEAQQK